MSAARGVDAWGYSLASANETALGAYQAGVESFVRWRTDAIAHLDAAIEADPGFALPKLAKGWVLQTARSDAYRPVIEGLVEAAAAVMDRSDARERAYLDGLRAALAGRGIEASTAMETMLVDRPNDVFAHRLVQFELFWNGRAATMRAVSERAAPAWREDMPCYGSFQSVRAFSLEEAGDYAAAERCGRDAVERDPSDCWGTHAVAHVLVMQGRVAEGVRWLEDLCGNWGEANQIKHHLWWHLCLFLLERGEHARILELLQSEIRNPDSPLVQAVPDATIDLQNFASLLMRLELRGVDVGERWEAMGEICAGRVGNMGNAFSSAHDMLVLCATERFEQAETLLANARAFAREGEGSLAASYRLAGVPICEAVLAHRRGEHERVIEALLPARHDFTLIGGSHAQRDLFFQILVDSAMRAGRADLVPVLLDDVAAIGIADPASRTLYADAVSDARSGGAGSGGGSSVHAPLRGLI